MAQYEKLINLSLLNQFLTKAKTIFAPKITSSGILKGDGQGGVSAATAGTDYLAPSALTPIESNLATVEQSSTASKLYNKGDYLVYNGQLYKVTATTISQGQTLTPGGNIQTAVACERDIEENRQIAVSDVFDLHPNVEKIYKIGYARKNNIISLDVMFKTTGDITNTTELFKINNIDRPTRELSSLLYSASSSAFRGSMVLTYVSGTQNQVRFVASGTVSAGDYMRAYFIYITG